MNIVKYKPDNSVFNWDFDTIFDNFFDNSFTGREGHHYPAVDVKEEDGQYTLTADLPGIEDKDLDISVKDDLLTISSRKQEETREEKKGYLIKERRDYAFSRSFVLPKDVDRDQISAAFKNGVLTLTMTKAPEAKPKQIKIKHKG